MYLLKKILGNLQFPQMEKILGKNIEIYTSQFITLEKFPVQKPKLVV